MHRRHVFAKRLAVVTGCSSGIGQTISKRLVNDLGMVVAGFSRRDPTQEIVSGLAEGRQHLFRHTHVNITSDPDVAAAVKGIPALLPPEVEEVAPLLVVHCAGVTQNKLLVRSPDVDIAKLMEVNVVGPLNVTRHLLRSSGMMKGSHGGAVVFIGSVVGCRGNAGQVAYSASKSALSGAVQSLAKEYSPSTRIRFNVVAPGLVDGPGMGKDLSEEQRTQWVERSCLGRLLEPDDVADAVLAVAWCQALNGQTIVLDGGCR